MSVSVITPSLPTRAGMLAECMASVAAQTHKPIEHLVAIDHGKRGPSVVRNGLLAAAAGEWVATLDDDDLFQPHHLERLSRETGDIIYGWCEVTGKPWNPNRHFNADELRQGNYIPATALIRTSLLRDLGGWHRDPRGGYEDWDLWLRALEAGAAFTCVPEITWTYRFHGGNRTERGRSAQ